MESVIKSFEKKNHSHSKLEDLIHKSAKAEESKIDVNSVKEFFNSITYVHLKGQSSAKIPIIMEEQKIFHSFLSKQLPPERYNGLVNWCYIFLYENATSEEIEGALVMCDSIEICIRPRNRSSKGYDLNQFHFCFQGYLYGNDTAATKTSYLTKFPDLSMCFMVIIVGFIVSVQFDSSKMNFIFGKISCNRLFR